MLIVIIILAAAFVGIPLSIVALIVALRPTGRHAARYSDLEDY